MNGSGDLVIGGSGDRNGEFTAEARRRGENQKPTTEARRHGEESGDLLIARDRVIGRVPSVLALFAKAIRTLRATLCEIFDESAYDRFLLRTNASRTAASYRAFMRERDSAMLKKPRCC